ncbi:MAG: hypothetical protein AAB549_00785 [Patescibacteria group bacterium]
MLNKPTKGEYLDILLRSSKTVFSTKDITLLWGEDQTRVVRERLKKYVKTGKLLRVHRGIYVKDKNYNNLELATKIYIPSYVSFETVLANYGVIFQLYRQIFISSYLTRDVVISVQTFSYKRVRDSILTNHTGVDEKDGYHVASPERAFLDVVYLNKSYHFDNLVPLNWKKIFDILPIYNNKSMEKRVKRYHNSADIAE